MSLFISLIKPCNRCPCWSWNSVISQSCTSSGSSSWWKFHFGFWSFWFATVTTKLKLSKNQLLETPNDFLRKISRLHGGLYLNSLIRDRDRSRRSFQAAMDASSSWLSMWNFNARSDRNDFEHFRQSYSPISEFCLILLRHFSHGGRIWNSSLASSFDQILVLMVSYIFGWLNYAGRIVEGMMC